MPDHRLAPLTPLGHATPHSETIGPVTITEVATTALASLATRRGREADVARAAETLNLPLPGHGHAASGPVYAAFWLGPDQWMVEAPVASHEDILAHLRPVFGNAASLTEQTDGWVRFDLTSHNPANADLPALFERLCALDTRAMQPGSATRTVIEHLGTYILRRPDRFTLLGPRSSAKSLLHALITAAHSAF